MTSREIDAGRLADGFPDGSDPAAAAVLWDLLFKSTQPFSSLLNVYLRSDLYSLLSKGGHALHVRSLCHMEKQSTVNPSLVLLSREINGSLLKNMTSKGTVGYLFWGNKEARLLKALLAVLLMCISDT